MTAGTPTSPGNPTATRGDGQVTLDWDTPSDDNGEPIEYYEYRVDDNSWTAISNDRRPTVTGLTNAREYTFEVRAVNSRGEGPSAEVKETPWGPPTEPRNLVAQPGDAQVTLTWDEPQSDEGSPVLRYEVRESRLDGSALWRRVSKDLDPLSVPVTGLQNGRQYTFEVRAVNARGDGDIATQSTTPLGTPTVPRNLVARPGDSQVTLTWYPPVEDGGVAITDYEYRIDRGEGMFGGVRGSLCSDGMVQEWCSAGTNLVETVAGLENARDYLFEVRAVSGEGVGSRRGPPTPTRGMPVGKPGAPRNLMAEPGDMQVTLTWLAPESTGGSPITGYEYRVDGAGNWIDTGTTRRATVTDLDNGTGYSFEVRAVNMVDPGEAVMVTTTPGQTPSAPRNLQATPGDGQVTLTWEAPESPGGSPITRYEYQIDAAGEWSDTEAPRRTTVSDLMNGVGYSFEVRAVTDQGEGEAATADATPGRTPSAPRELQAMTGDGQVTLTWEAPESTGGSPITRYEYRGGATEGWNAVGTARRVTVTGLENGTVYGFAVRAVNEQGEGPEAEKDATPAQTPSMPRNLEAAPGDEAITLTWQAPLSTGGFPIERYEYRRDGTGGWTSTETNRRVTVTGLENGTDYSFEVRAFNEQGAGEAATTEATPGQTPPAPGNLEAAPGDGQITLTWEAPSSTGGSRIQRYEYRVDGIGGWVGTGIRLEVTVTGLTNGLEYSFEMRGVNAQGEGTAAIVTATPAKTPSVPRDLEAAPGDGEVTLIWRAPLSTGGFPIMQYEYRVDGTGNWIDTGTTNRRATVPRLDNGVGYSFELRAVNEVGAGEAATTDATPGLTPPAPRKLEATPGDGQVTLTWEAPPSTGGSRIERYEYRVDGIGDWVGTGTRLEVTVTGLTNGLEYSFEVRGVNAQGEGTAAIVTATPAKTPSVPRDLEAAPGDGEVTLIWQAPLSTGGFPIMQYEYRVDGTGNWIDTGTTRRATVTPLDNGVGYSFEVRAVNERGAGEVATTDATPGLAPPAPRKLETTPGDGQVTLTWEAPLSTGGSRIERYEYRVDGIGDWVGTGTRLEVTVTGLTNGLEYSFDVRGVNAQGEGTAETATATPAQTPSVPRDLEAVPGDVQVTLTWNAPLSGFPIVRYEYRIDGTGEWIGTGTTRRAMVTPLDNGVGYSFEVRAVNERGAGEAVMVTTTPGLTPPVPRSLQATPGDGQVTLTWDAPLSTGGIRIRRYEYRVDGAGSWIDTGTTLEAMVTGLRNGRSYSFEVRAVNVVGEGDAATATATLGTLSGPRNLSATPGDGQVTLRWEAPSSGGVPVERYEYRIDGAGSWIGTGTALEAVVTGLRNGRRYRFEVRAVTTQGYGTTATVVAAPVLGPPGSPAELTAEAVGPRTIRLSWSAPPRADAIVGYRLEVSADGGSIWRVLIANTGNAAGTTYEHTGLSGGSTRHYRVAAISSSGAGGTSNVAGATTDMGPPAAPRNLRAVPDDRRVTLAWEAPSRNGGSPVIHYEYRVDGAGSWIGTGTALEAVVTGLRNGRRHGFEVRAVNALGEGEAATAMVTVGRVDRVVGAWLGGFGRAVAEHVSGGVQERLAASHRAGLKVKLAGRTIGGRAHSGGTDAHAWQEDLAALVRDMGAEVEDHRPLALTARDLLAGSEFALTRGMAPGARVGVWGRAAHSGVDRNSGPVSVDGKVTTATLGADYGNRLATLGLAVTHSFGDGSYAGDSGRGEMESALTGIYPYAGYALTDRLSVWGTGGVGKGTLTLKPEGSAAVEADIDQAMAAVGAREAVPAAARWDGLHLAVETDGLWMRTANDAAPGFAAARAQILRLRYGLEGAWPMALDRRRTLTPSLEIALRHDSGDAETGFGADIGGGVALTDASGVFAMELSARSVVVHQESDFRQWSVSGSFGYDRNPTSGRGLSLSLRPYLGSSASGGAGGADAWSRLDGGDHSGRRHDPGGGLEAEIAYGVPVLGGRLLGAPHAELTVSEAGRDYAIGWRFEPAPSHAGLSFDLGVAAERRERVGDEPEDRVGLNLALRW